MTAFLGDLSEGTLFLSLLYLPPALAPLSLLFAHGGNVGSPE
jgi:hypothetical protein